MKNITEIKYYEIVLQDDQNLSICLDSDVGYYHHFNKGDIISVEEKKSISKDGITFSNLILKIEHIEITNPIFILNWSKVDNYRFTLRANYLSGKTNYMKDVTLSMYRDKKLNTLGI